MTQGITHKFAGSKVEVQTAFGTAKTVSGISRADPAIVSAAAHGFAKNTIVQLSGIDGMTELNDSYFPVGLPLASGTFALYNTDTSQLNAFVTDSPNLAVATPVIFSNYCELTGYQRQGAAPNQTETSTICSTFKEFVNGLPDTGTVTLDYHWALDSSVQQAIEAAEASGEEIAIRITDPAGNAVIIFGVVQTTSESGSVSSVVWSGTAAIKLSGAPFRILASS